MTCASCAARIEKRLNRMPGVSASVNFATERAVVTAPVDLDPADLVAEVGRTGYSAALPAAPGDAGAPAQAVSDADAGADGGPREGAELRALRQRLLGAVVLSVPVIVLAMVPALQFTYWQWASLALAAPVVVWGAWPFHRAATINLRHGAATMDTLISMGVTAAFLWSLYALFLGHAGMPGMTHAFEWTVQPSDGAGDIYLEVAAGVTTFVLAGRYIEMRAKRRAGAALRALLDLGAKDAAVLRPDAEGVLVESRIPIAALTVGDRFIVRPGEKVATDGVVEAGTSALDVSMVTGESIPRDVAPGDAVVGATVNTAGRLVVRATRVGADTQLAQMARLVDEAQSGKARIQRLADRISGVFVPIVLVLSALTLTTWLVLGAPASFAFTAAVTVLIIACPCALGLATPIALLVGTGRGARLGILIKGPEVLESTRRVDTVVLDKTGTVTTGRMSVTEVRAFSPAAETDLLRAAAALEDASEHPIARAIAAAAPGEAPLPAAEAFQNVPGLGVSGQVEGRTVLVGRAALLREWAVAVPDDLLAAQTSAETAGRTAVLVALEGVAAGLIVVADTPKPDARQAVADLRALGLTPILLTGDNAGAAHAVAREVGIDEVVSDVLPADKVDVVRKLQASGRVVAMVGDGVNDAAALAQADLGIAMGTGTDAAIEASDLTLVRGDLRSAADAIRLSRATLRTIKTNLFWAFAYNVAALPLAALGLLNPMIAGAAMALSSTFVVANSARLRSFRALSATPRSATPSPAPMKESS
ncbi:heavy metal translocating P-type ATPase [Microbacterium sp. NPDC077184]|uniref:heavy metal translocating P-type ATPase n=1 Tax=Microbacterium sp. NPDC077184 TaxID=3154764 RepID=UPI0034204595